MIAELLAELRGRGVQLSLDNGSVKCVAPRGALTPELIERITENKPALVGVLSFARLHEGSTAVSTFERIPEADRKRPLPLSLSQQRLWFMDSLRPGTALLNLPCAFRIHGPLDLDVLRAALRKIVQRHESLRTTIRLGDFGPEQVVRSDVSFELEESDGSQEPDQWHPGRIRQSLLPIVSRPFSDTEAPLFRVGVVRLGPREHVFWLVASHLVWDGWSFDIFIEELRTLYAAFEEGRPSPLPPLPIQYGDYVVWHSNWLAQSEQRRQLEYWKEKLGGALPTLALPVDKTRPAQMGYRGTSVPFRIPRPVVNRLRALARSEGATMQMVLLAALDVLLYRYTGERDLVVGAQIEGRIRPETERLIGLFANTVVLRVPLDPTETFRDLLAAVRATCVDASDHQNTPFEQLVEALRPPRDRSRTPLFQVMFSYQQVEKRGTGMGSVNLEQLHVHPGSSGTDLTYRVKDDGRGVCGGLEYSSDLFERETAERVLLCMNELLEEIARDPDCLVDELDGCKSHRVQVDAWNTTAVPLSSDALVSDLVQDQAERTPNAVAVRFEDEKISYRGLSDRTARLAAKLSQMGVGPNAIVGLCVRRSIDLVVAMIAIQRAGGAYLPLDPSYPRARLEYMLADSGAGLLVCESATRELLSAAHVSRLIMDQEPALSGPDSFPKPAACSARQLAYVIYTSGSTGRPKGVLVEHRNVVNFLSGMQDRVDLSPGGVWLAGTSISFDISVLEIFGALSHGFTVVLLGDQLLGDAARAEHGIASLVERYGVTHFQCTPSQASLLLSDPGSRKALSRLRQLLVGGEALPRELAADLRSLGVTLINMYGPTETTVWSATHEVTATSASIPIGRPIANTRFYVLDAAKRIRPIGASGELFIAGAGVARGYHLRPELTAERFLPDPFDAGGRMYATGDLVRHRFDGALEFLGRNDHQVKIRGYRIELGEIESALVAHSAVKDAVVSARSDGHEGTRLVAYVVPRDVAVSSDALRAHLRSALPPYMIPAAFVVMEALPLTPNGKVDRKALPAPEAGVDPSRRFPPRDATESELLGIWQAALGVSGIGVEDDFFDLGGHSLLGVRLLSDVHHAFGIRLSLAVLFEAPNVAAMAARIREAMGGNGTSLRPALLDAWTTVVPIHPHGALPPFFCVAGKGGNPMNLRHVAAHLDPDQPFFGLQHRGVDGNLDPHEAIQDMAAEFIADVRRIQPSGPYYIGGFSGGGTAAFEMAQQLRASGEIVGALVLLEGINPQLPKWGATERARYHASRLAGEGISYVTRAARNGVQRRTGLLRERLLSKAAKIKPFEYRNEAVTVAWNKMENEYVPAPYPGSIYLLRSRKRDTLVFDVYNGWRPVVLGEIFVREVEGGHVSFVDPQNAMSSARQLEDILREAREQFARRRGLPPSSPSDDRGTVGVHP